MRNAASTLPDVPALAASMARLQARTAEAEARKVHGGSAESPTHGEGVVRQWMVPKKNSDGSATTVTLCGRYAILRTPSAPPFRYTAFELNAGCRYVLGGFDTADEAKRACP